MSDAFDLYESLSKPPAWALRPIRAGRLKGKTDINPQWRIEAMTQAFGSCGVGWRFEVKRLWTEPGPDDQVFAFAEVLVFTKQGDEWTAPIPGIGGNMLVEKEKSGPHANDEAYKMAVTDALSTALRMLGVGAAIYAGAWDGSRYRDTAGGTDRITEAQWIGLKKAWFAGHKEDLEGKDPKQIAQQFCWWVAEVLDVTPDSFDAMDYAQWTVKDHGACKAALSAKEES